MMTKRKNIQEGVSTTNEGCKEAIISFSMCPCQQLEHNSREDGKDQEKSHTYAYQERIPCSPGKKAKEKHNLATEKIWTNSDGSEPGAVVWILCCAFKAFLTVDIHERKWSWATLIIISHIHNNTCVGLEEPVWNDAHKGRMKCCNND